VLRQDSLQVRAHRYPATFPGFRLGAYKCDFTAL